MDKHPTPQEQNSIIGRHIGRGERWQCVADDWSFNISG
jgi:hypothetical protein